MKEIVKAFVSNIIEHFSYHPFIAPYLGINKPLEHFLHQYEILALLSVRRPIRVLIADEIGLGKTITALAVCKYLEKLGATKRTLVIVPRVLLPQWLGEMEKMGIVNVFDIERTSIKTLERMNFPAGYYIGSIDLLKREEYKESISRVDWDLIIVDEAHKLSITGPRKTIRYEEIGGLIGSRLDINTIFLTATPHKGDPEDYISRLKLLDPMLGSPKELDRREFYTSTHETLVFRRTKESINNIYEKREIFKPAKFHALALPATEQERRFNQRLLEFMRTKLREFADMGLLADPRVIPLLMALLFKRASSSPKAVMLTIERMLLKRAATPLTEDLIEEVNSMFKIGYEDYEFEFRKTPEETLDSFIDAVAPLLSERDREEIRLLHDMANQIIATGDTKVQVLIDELTEILSRKDEKIIVFTEYKDTLNYIYSKILEVHPDWKQNIVCLSSEEAGDRHKFKEIRSKFETNPKVRIMLATDVAAEGLNLQVANHLFNYEVPWSVIKLEQRIGRIWRLGQKREAQIYTLFLGNRSDSDALEILYKKLFNIKRAGISQKPILGEKIVYYQTDASEIGKVPMISIGEKKRRKFKKVTEWTLIKSEIRGELASIVNSILAAREELEKEMQGKSIFYRPVTTEQIQEKIAYLGFKDPQEVRSSLFNLLKTVADLYGYMISKDAKNALIMQQATGMPMIISRIDEAVELLKQSPRPQITTPILVAYDDKERTDLIYEAEICSGEKRLVHELIAIAIEEGKVLRGKDFLDEVSKAITNLIGATDITKQPTPQIDTLVKAYALNSIKEPYGRLLSFLREYLFSLIRLGLRNKQVDWVLPTDLEVRIKENPVAILHFVKKPLIPYEEIPEDVRSKAEEEAIKYVLEIETKEGRTPQLISQQEQKVKHYDIYSINFATGEDRIIEVKGHMGQEVYGELTHDEAMVAKQEGKRYWLYIVYNIQSKPTHIRFQDPFNTMNYKVLEKITKETKYVLWPREVPI
jgi:superfamily II DNA or RNA helicase